MMMLRSEDIAYVSSLQQSNNFCLTAQETGRGGSNEAHTSALNRLRDYSDLIQADLVVGELGHRHVGGEERG